MDDEFYQLAIDEINIENEKEILQREAIKKQQQAELARCQQRLDNLLRLKISPDNKDNELLSDEEFISQKKETLGEMRIIKEKIEDANSQNQHWFNLCVNYVNFMRALAVKFENGSPEQRRDIFKFVYYNPAITTKVLGYNEKTPHKYIAEYNAYKEATITAENPLFTNKKDAFASLCSFGREKVDGIITFFKENRGYYWMPRFD